MVRVSDKRLLTLAEAAEYPITRVWALRGLIWDGPLLYVRCFKSRVNELEFRETKRDK